MSIILPTNILRRMSKEERSKLGKGNQLPEEIAAKCEAKSERELQSQMSALLTIKGVFFFSNRMDKRPTVPRGLPDFTIIMPNQKAWLVEAKIKGGKLSEAQVKMHEKYAFLTSGTVSVIYSLDEFKSELDLRLKQNFHDAYSQ